MNLIAQTSLYKKWRLKVITEGFRAHMNEVFSGTTAAEIFAQGDLEHETSYEAVVEELCDNASKFIAQTQL